MDIPPEILPPGAEPFEASTALSYAVPSARPPRPRVWPTYVSFVLVLVAMVLMIVVVAMSYLAYLTVQAGGMPRKINPEAMASTPWVIALSIVGMFVILMGAAAIPAMLSRTPFRLRLALQRPRLPWGILLLGVVGSVAYSLASDSVLYFLNVKSSSINALGDAITNAGLPWLMVLTLLIGIIGPIGEELYCRGYLQTRLVQRHGPIAGIIIASLCFGFLHMDWYQSPFAFGFGLFAGFIAYRAGSILPAIAAHTINNILTVVITRWVPDVGSTVEIIVLIVGALVAAGTFRLLLRWPRRPEEPAAPRIQDLIAATATTPNT